MSAHSNSFVAVRLQARRLPDLMPVWNILDATPEGRAKEWYPKLQYK
jgi:predicted dithiol-disulfide oxidoreductase (DUF899 family)